MKRASFSPVVKYLGITEYSNTLQLMQDFTANRSIDTPDQIWVTEHHSVYTLGISKRSCDLPRRLDIPLVSTDRGGKITYHGPGQLVIYLLLDMVRMDMTVIQLVNSIEASLLQFLKAHHISAELIPTAPGVYVQGKKIASLGLRVRKGYCYHGLSLNVAMDLSPFSSIDPCGYQDLQVTQLSEFDFTSPLKATAEQVTQCLIEKICVT
jgi:lipoyl(octanoyl) transferase